MKIKSFSAWILLAILIAPAISCSRAAQKSESLRNVVLVEVISADSDRATNYSGVIEEAASVSASFMADGRLREVFVKEGDRVVKGQLIAALDDSDYRIGVSQLQAQVDQMTKEKERMDAMFAKHNIAPNDYEKFEAGYQQLKLQLEMAMRKLDYTRLYAPTSGYVATKYMNVGELVGAGHPVFNIINDSNLSAAVNLPVDVYINRKNIVSAKGYVPGLEGEIPMSIISFTPDAENNMLYRMKLSIPASSAKELAAGMNISVWLSMADDSEAGFMVPSRAIFDDNGDSFVWVFNSADSTITKKKIQVEGIPAEGMSMVVGVQPGESIVETGVKQLYQGEKVNVLNRRDIGM